MSVTVTVERDSPGGTDPHGDPLPVTTTSHLLEGCGVAPRTSDDINDPGRHGIVVGVDLFAPPGADIELHDRIVIGASDPMPGRYEIDGDIADWRNKFTDIGRGRVVPLKRAEG